MRPSCESCAKRRDSKGGLEEINGQGFAAVSGLEKTSMMMESGLFLSLFSLRRKS